MKSLPAFIGLFTLLALAGCSLHPSQLGQADLALPPVFIESGQPAAAQPLSRWWEEFGDDTLNSLMVETLANNLDLRQASARLAQLEASSRIAAAGLLPFVNAGAQANRSQQQGISGETRGTNYNLSLAAGYELDLWRKISARTVAAGFTAQASTAELKALYITLSAQLADLYFLAVEQRAQLKLTDQIIATLADNLARLERRYESGIAPAKDLYQARQNLAAARENRPQFEARLATTLHAISLLLGRFPDHAIAGQRRDLPASPPPTAPGLPAQLLSNRPDIEAAYLRLAARDAGIAAAIADRLPSLSLRADYGKAHNEFGTLGTTGIFWNLIAELTAPILDGGRRRAEVDRTRAAFDETLAAYAQTVIKAVNEVEDALAAGKAAEERLAHLTSRTAATGASLRLANADYFEGLTDYLPVLLAQQFHFQAQSQLLAARRQVLADRITLFRALGGTWPAASLNPALSMNSKGHAP